MLVYQITLCLGVEWGSRAGVIDQGRSSSCVHRQCGGREGGVNQAERRVNGKTLQLFFPLNLTHSC